MNYIATEHDQTINEKSFIEYIPKNISVHYPEPTFDQPQMGNSGDTEGNIGLNVLHHRRSNTTEDNYPSNMERELPVPSNNRRIDSIIETEIGLDIQAVFEPEVQTEIQPIIVHTRNTPHIIKKDMISKIKANKQIVIEWRCTLSTKSHADVHQINWFSKFYNVTSEVIAWEDRKLCIQVCRYKRLKSKSEFIVHISGQNQKVVDSTFQIKLDGNEINGNEITPWNFPDWGMWSFPTRFRALMGKSKKETDNFHRYAKLRVHEETINEKEIVVTATIPIIENEQ